jgi:RNA polymerase sigma-70 factor (ECF subfamily)
MEPFVQALAGPALQLATLLTQDRAVGEDIVQEAFFRAWRSANTPRDLAGFRRWLYRIVVNLSRDHQRRSAAWRRLRMVTHPLTDPGVVVEDRAIGAALASAIGRLSRREREALYLRFFEDADYQEVAEITGLREGACRVLIHRALKKVGAQLSAEGLAPEGART